MPINFPDTPTVNQVFVSGNKTWKWTGTRWEILVIDTTSPIIQSVQISSDVILAPQTKGFVDTTAARILTLPIAPNLGDQIELFDANNLASTNNVTILNNSNKINGVLDSAILDMNAFAAVFVWTGSDYGWRLI